jgi:hypothetical protein
VVGGMPANAGALPARTAVGILLFC